MRVYASLPAETRGMFLHAYTHIHAQNRALAHSIWDLSCSSLLLLLIWRREAQAALLLLLVWRLKLLEPHIIQVGGLMSLAGCK